MSPNIIAYCALFGWPLVVFALFKLLSRPNAAIWSILAGYLFLPPRFGVDFSVLPQLDKAFMPSVFVVIAAFVFRGGGDETTNPHTHRASKLLIFLVVLLLVGPFITVQNNPEPIVFPGRFIPGLTLYDALGVFRDLMVAMLPFFIGRRLLANQEGHALLLRAYVLAGLIYSFLILVEVRLSPQLNTWVYGYFAHSFEQHIRDGGFRPIVFLSHGLWVGLFMATATLAAASVWRQKGKKINSLVWLYSTLWLFFVLYLSKTLGAFALTVLLLPLVLFASGRVLRLTAGVVAVCVLVYPVLRGADLVPVDVVFDFALSISEDRAYSFKTRLDNEDALLARALEKPITGWGLWGRSNLFDPETGQSTSITDGAWIIALGSFGWLGYIAQFGLLCLPLFFLASKRGQEIPFATSGLCILLALNLIDLIPNATLTPLTFLTAGALMGFCEQFVRPKRKQSNSRGPKEMTLFPGSQAQRKKRS